MGRKDNIKFMELALAQAHAAGARGEVPVGCVIVSAQGEILSAVGNEMRARHDPTAHSEILAIRAASETLGNERLIGCEMFVTLEPCAMCAGAISFARIERLYIGALDQKSGGVEHGGAFFSQTTCHHAPEVYSGFCEEESQALLQAFFKQRRDKA